MTGAKVQTKGKSVLRVNAKITRADGSVEDWGRITYRSRWEALWYAVTHPILMAKRRYWQWQALSRTQA